MIQGKNILIISTDAWGEYYLSKHHYAIQLANMGNQVYFLNYANLKGKGTSVAKVEHIPNLHIVDYDNAFRGLRWYPQSIQKRIYARTIKKLRQHLPALDIVWSFDAFRFSDLRLFEAQLNIFHPVDLYHSPIEQQIAESADIIFGTSQSIIDHYHNIDKAAYKINHGLADVFLEMPNTEHLHLEGHQKIKIGLIGNLTQMHLSHRTLQHIVLAHHDLDFHFIGPRVGADRLSKKRQDYLTQIETAPNTYFIPSQPYTKLKKYMALMDVLLICYDRERSDEAPPNPHKLLEYLSSGKVIVSNYFEEYKAQADIINMAPKLADYPSLFAQTIKKLSNYQTDELIQKRINFARENTYRKQIERICLKLAKHQLLPK